MTLLCIQVIAPAPRTFGEAVGLGLDSHSPLIFAHATDKLGQFCSLSQGLSHGIVHGLQLCCIVSTCVSTWQRSLRAKLFRCSRQSPGWFLPPSEYQFRHRHFLNIELPSHTSTTLSQHQHLHTDHHAITYSSIILQSSFEILYYCHHGNLRRVNDVRSRRLPCHFLLVRCSQHRPA